MKPQNKKKRKRKNGGIVESLIPTFFQNKFLLMSRQKLFWAKKLWGGCSKLED